jgi:chromosomal replication initiator protein
MKHHISPESIDEIVAQEWMIDPSDLRRHIRKREIVEARQVAMYIQVNISRLRLVQVAKMYNHDHATVIYALKTVQNLRETDRYYSRKFDNVMAEIEQFKQPVKIKYSAELYPGSVEIC